MVFRQRVYFRVVPLWQDRPDLGDISFKLQTVNKKICYAIPIAVGVYLLILAELMIKRTQTIEDKVDKINRILEKVSE